MVRRGQLGPKTDEISEVEDILLTQRQQERVRDETRRGHTGGPGRGGAGHGGVGKDRPLKKKS